MAESWKPAGSGPNSYEVQDRGDVRHMLDELGVDSVGEIRRAHGSYHHRIDQAQDAERLDLHATGTPDQIAANFAALEHARCQLTRQADEVNALLTEARDLAGPMDDGHGPIARAMSTAFRERADDAQGVVRALTDYRDELNLVLDAIQRTLNNYSNVDATAARQVGVSGGDDVR